MVNMVLLVRCVSGDLGDLEDGTGFVVGDEPQ